MLIVIHGKLEGVVFKNCGGSFGVSSLAFVGITVGVVSASAEWLRCVKAIIKMAFLFRMIIY